MPKQTKNKSETIKKRTGENVYVGKYEHLFNKKWTENEIKSLADELHDWMVQDNKNLWFKDFLFEKKISNQRVSEFATNNPYFAFMLDLCKNRQESLMFKLGTSKATNPAMFILGLKNNHGWKDYQENVTGVIPEIIINVRDNKSTT